MADVRPSVIVLREEARRLYAAIGEIVVDQKLAWDERGPLLRQMTTDLDDIRKALLTLGGCEALDTILTAP